MSAKAASGRTLYVIGAGGHAKEVLATAQAQGWSDASIRVVDDAQQAWGKHVLGFLVSGPSSRILEDPEALAVLAIGSNRVRARLASAARCSFATLVHPSAVVHGSCLLGAGTVVFAGAVLQPEARLGAQVIIGSSATVSHDCQLGDAVHLAPGVRLAGAVRVGAQSALGTGAVVIPGISIGEAVTVGAGAAVIRDLPDGVTAVGVPARIVRKGA